MYYKFIRYIFAFILFFPLTLDLAAQCADTRPEISGPKAVTNSQDSVIYSTPAIPGHTYVWSITGGAGSTIISGQGTNQIKVNWGAVSNGTVSVTETNPALACSTSIALNVKIQPLLVAYLYYTNESCYGDSLQFFATPSIADPTKPIVLYEWNFGDGFTGTGPVIFHQYLPPYNTTWDVTLIVTNSEGYKDTIYDAVYVNPDQFIPHPDFLTNMPSCAYEAVQFDASISTTPPGTLPWAQFQWDFGDPASPTNLYSGTTPLASHTFSAPGLYTITLTAVNDKYCIGTFQRQVNIQPSVPTAGYQYSSPTCINNPTFFTDQSTFPAGHNIVQWEWHFGDGATPVIINGALNGDTSHTYSSLGPFPAMLIVTNDLGCKDTITRSISLTPSPTALFSNTSSCFGEKVTFTSTSILNNGPGITSYSWNFDDPASGFNTSNDPVVDHTFSAVGDYDVQLIVINTAGCPDTITKTITIFPIPPVEYTWNVGSTNNEIHFHLDQWITPIGMIGNQVQWYFGDGQYGYGYNPIHVYPTGGLFDVTLTVTDTIGCSNSITHQILVPSVPVALFETNSPVCLGQPINIIDHSSNPAPSYVVQWIWNWGDPSPNDTTNFPAFDGTISHYYNLADTFAITLTVIDNNGFTDTYTRDVIILSNPIANFGFTDGCAGQAVDFWDMSLSMAQGNIISYDWNFGDPLSGTENGSLLKDPQHTFSTGGIYDVRLIVENMNGCIDTIIKQVPVRFAPTVDFKYDTACIGQLVNFAADTAFTHVDSIATWQWNFGDGNTVLDFANTSHLYTAPGLYDVILTVTDIHGCKHDTTHKINVNPLPVAEFIWTPPACSGTSVHFDDNSLVPLPYTGWIGKWMWEFNDGSPAQTIILGNDPDVFHIFPTTSNSYTVRLTVWSNDSCTNFIEKVIDLTPAPVAAFSYSSINCSDQPVTFTDNSQMNGVTLGSRQWDFGDPASGLNNFSTLPNPTHQFATSGSYAVKLIIVNTVGCADTIVDTIAIQAKPLATFTADTVCFNSPTTFTASFPTGIINYFWDFGDGFNSTATSPTHTYASYGVQTVTLTVTNSLGCTKDTTRQILINPLPISAFTYSAPNCEGAVVHYTDQSSTVPGFLGQIVRWTWDFGDGSFANKTWPQIGDVDHVFLGAALTHTVRLTVKTADSCEHFIEHIVTSVPAPIANFTFPTNNCSEQSVQFSDGSAPNGGVIVAWQWNFGDPTSGGNNISSAQNPIHFFSQAGTYNVNLIVTNSSNCTDTIEYPVTVIALPTANFACDTVCLGSPTSFTSPSGQNIVQWSWEFGDGGTSLVQNPAYTYAADGIYAVRLEVITGDGCKKDTTKNVLVLAKPIAAFTTSAPACASDSIAFNDNSYTSHGSVHDWLWDFGDGNTVTRTWPASPDVKHKYAAAGNYTVTLTITTTDLCTAEKSIAVNIQASPLVNFDWGTQLCENMPVQFNDLTQPNGGAGLTQWSWDFDDPASGSANTSNLQSPEHSFTTDGTFNVKLIVTNAAGCESVDSADVSINVAPLAQYSADTACEGNITTFTDESTSSSGTITAWLWNFDDLASGANNTSTLQNPTHVFTGIGTYDVTLTVTNSSTCTKDTVMQISVNPKPIADFEFTTSCVNSETQFTDLSIAPGSSVISWTWDFGDGTGTSTDQNPVYTYATAGTYNVKLIVGNLNNCPDSIIIPVTVRPTPIAAYSYTTFYCPSGQVNFQDESQGQGAAIVERLWIFEPGYTSNLINPVHIFSTPAMDYPVTLIATDNYGCSDTIIDTVAVKPGAAFTFDHDTVCFGNPSHFTPQNLAPGDTLYSVSWNFGDPASGPNNISYDYNGVHIFTTPGLYYVKMNAVNSDNCADSIFLTVTVNALPEPQYSFTSVPCDSVIRFNESSVPGSGSITSWEWTFGDGSPSIIIPAPGTGDTSHIYSALGTYPVLLKVNNSNGCSDTIMQTVERYPCILAGFSHDDTLLCARYPIMFTDTSLPTSIINQWHWFFGDGTDTLYTTHAPVITHEYAGAGTFNVKLIIDAAVSGKNFTDSLTQLVTVRPTPLAGFRSNATCFGLPNVFNDTSLSYSAPITEWTWTFGDPGSGISDTSHQKNPVHEYDSAYVYPVQLIVMNQYGCSDTLLKDTRVYAIPEARFESSLACEMNPTYFTDITSTGDTSISMWHWNFGDLTTKQDTSLLQDPEYKYTTAGEYLVRLIVRDRNGCYDTVDSIVNALISPISAFSLTDNVNGMTGKVKFNNASSGADTYYWDFGNGKSSVDESPTVTFDEDGTYLVMLISKNQNDCFDTSYYNYEVLFKGLYIPNAFLPTSSNVLVRTFKAVGVNLKTFNIEVFDAWGHMIWSSNKLDLDGRPTEAWDGTDENGTVYPPGTYMWKASATFIDGAEWIGSDIGKGEFKTMGTVTLIR